MTILEQRRIVQHLIEDNSIVDAPTAYYGLYHAPNRSKIVTALRPSGRPMGFVGRFQTGMDLFRPVVTMHCNSAETAAALMADTLTPGRPYIFFTNANQYPYLGGSVAIQMERLLHIYYLDGSRFRPEVNVMVQQKTTAGGSPRFEVHSNSLMAVAGINWESPGFAELYVYTEPQARRKGWGRACVMACSEYIIRGGRQPLYLVEPENIESVNLAEAVGFVDSGGRQVYVEGVYTGHPMQEPINNDEAQTASA